MAKVIFAGTTEFGIPTLEHLKRDFDLVAVISQPDKPVGRNKVMTSPAVKKWAEASGVKVLQPEKIADAAADIQAFEPDVMIVAAYGQIIPADVLKIPKNGSINIHGSLLPKYRGASPIQAALIHDDSETGVTLIVMDEKMDHGPILAKSTVKIVDTDNYLSLHRKLSESGAQLLSEALPKFIGGTIQPAEQNHEQATFVKMISRDDARIDWTTPARSILQQIKALNPEPGTWTTLDGKSVKIMGAEENRSTKIQLPGQIYIEGRDCMVKCRDYSLKLTLVQPEGKTPISGSDFLNGLKNLETKVLV